MKCLTFLILLILLVQSELFAGTLPNNDYKLGKGTDTVDKGITFDTGDGANNVSLKVTDSKKLDYSGNDLEIGDGTSSNDKIITIDPSSGAALKWEGSDNYVEIRNENVRIGKDVSNDISLLFGIGGPNPGFKYNSATQKVEVSHNGSTFTEIPTSGFSLGEAVKGGCFVSRTDSDTLEVEDCTMGIGANSIVNATATATWGCGGCDTEATGTGYYAYVETSSSGSFISLKFTTDVPDSSGLDSSGNKVLAKFYNNHNGDIDQYSIDQWKVNGFEPQFVDWTNMGSWTFDGTTTAPTKGTVVTDVIYGSRKGSELCLNYLYRQSAAGGSGAGDYLIELPLDQFRANDSVLSFYTTFESSGVWDCQGNNLGESGWYNNGQEPYTGIVCPYDNNNVRMFLTSKGTDTAAGADAAPIGPSLSFGGNSTWVMNFCIPIKGWGKTF